MDLEMWPVDVSEQDKQFVEQAKQFVKQDKQFVKQDKQFVEQNKQSVELAENYDTLRLRQSLPIQRQVDYIATLAMRLSRDPVIELTAINTKAQASHKIDQLLDELKTDQLNELDCELHDDGQAERG